MDFFFRSRFITPYTEMIVYITYIYYNFLFSPPHPNHSFLLFYIFQKDVTRDLDISLFFSPVFQLPFPFWPELIYRVEKVHIKLLIILCDDLIIFYFIWKQKVSVRGTDDDIEFISHAKVLFIICEVSGRYCKN